MRLAVVCGKVVFLKPHTNIFIVVYKVLATANQDRSQITCYAANGDWVATCYVMCFESIHHAISIQHLVLQELWKLQYKDLDFYIIKQTVMLGTLEH